MILTLTSSVVDGFAASVVTLPAVVADSVTAVTMTTGTLLVVEAAVVVVVVLELEVVVVTCSVVVVVVPLTIVDGIDLSVSVAASDWVVDVVVAGARSTLTRSTSSVALLNSVVACSVISW